jgi:hypothetical protein
VSARTPLMHRITALVAMFALAFNFAALPLAHAHALDGFGQPICSEHVNTALDGGPAAPTSDIACQFCCTLSIAAWAASPVLPLPSAIAWKEPAIVVVALQLPSPSRHLLGPPRGPPFA